MTPTRKYELTCNYCGEKFHTYFPNRRACNNPNCHRKAVRDTKKALQDQVNPRAPQEPDKPAKPAEPKEHGKYIPSMRTCEICGREFKSPTGRALVCSPRCRTAKWKRNHPGR